VGLRNEAAREAGESIKPGRQPQDHEIKYGRARGSGRQRKAWGASPRITKLNSGRARDSGRKHKAWGASPRITKLNSGGARDSGRQRIDALGCRPLHGLNRILIQFLGLAPQALCRGPLRGLGIDLSSRYSPRE